MSISNELMKYGLVTKRSEVLTRYNVMLSERMQFHMTT